MICSYGYQMNLVFVFTQEFKGMRFRRKLVDLGNAACHI